MKVTVLKTLLNGNPFIVLDDGHANFIPPTLITSNSTYWILDLYYHHSQHEIFVEGINSVPEFPAITAIALIALALSLVVIKHRKAHAK